MRYTPPAPLWSRPARGEWIEIDAALAAVLLAVASRPARGEWIEIQLVMALFALPLSRPARDEWIEIFLRTPFAPAVPSRPARGEWIEMRHGHDRPQPTRVSPREGRVD